MTGSLSIAEIKYRLGKAAGDFTTHCSALSDEHFFYHPGEKWSAAQQVKHLVTATDTARLAFTLPKFMLRMAGGKPNRPSRTYDELVAKYKLKLEQGGRASGRYIPKPILPAYGKEKLLASFTKSMRRFAEALQKNWNEPQPDQYIVPHPLLGKVTLRELCYFTIHHTYHHLESIQKMAIQRC